MTTQRVLDLLYANQKSPLEFNFDMLTAPPLLSLLSINDIAELNSIAKSVKLAGKIDQKYKLIDTIMTRRGFSKLHAGTNRVVYKFLEDQRFVIKVAVDRVGLGDNPAEFKNQFLLKPFVTKVFEVSPCGTVGVFERVNPIMSREEFMSVADDVFNLITKVFIGKYILEDFGSWYFLNWGTRKNGAGIVLLDFPYVYELDGNKLYCNAPVIPGNKDLVCGGQLDYDAGFNNLVCTKCGRHYHARDLAKTGKDKLIIVGGKKKMRVQIKYGNEIIHDSGVKSINKVIEPSTENKTVNKDTKPVEKINIDKQKEQPKVDKEETIDKQVSTDNTTKTTNNNLSTENSTEVKKKFDKPSAAIFNKVKKEEPKEEQPVYDNMYDELEDVLDQYRDDDDFDDDYYDEYEDKFLNNRQRSSIRNSAKKRKSHSDFSDF